MSSETVWPLCEACSSIEFELSKIWSWPGAGEPLPPGQRRNISWDLEWPRPEGSQCPFCKLLETFYAKELYLNCDQSLQQLQWLPQSLGDYPEERLVKVWVGWGKTSGPSGRGALSLRLGTKRPTYIIDFSPNNLCFVKEEKDSAVQDCDTKPWEADRYLRPKIEPQFNTARLRKWLVQCAENHSSACNIKPAPFEKAFPGLPVLRLIDVRLGCVVEKQKLCEYVALSYVWGAVPSVRLSTANKANLSLLGALHGAHTHLPRTIRDAIDFTHTMGLRYLWVDALCLVQNDRKDVDAGVNVMDEIYERAYFTIVAASGHNANAGLPGLVAGSRIPVDTTVEVKPGVRLGVCTELDALLGQSVYNSRGWTQVAPVAIFLFCGLTMRICRFQESLLSRRAVYFLPDQVYFRCREQEYSEMCLDPDDQINPDWRGPGGSLDLTAAPLHSFGELVEAYSRKALSHDGDSLRAMAGIMRRFSDTLGYSFLHGLPVGAFDAGILFGAEGGTLRRRKDFPSYSWAGWKGPLMMHLQMFTDSPGTMNEAEGFTAWIVWHVLQPSEGSLPLLDWRPEGTRQTIARKWPLETPCPAHLAPLLSQNGPEHLDKATAWLTGRLYPKVAGPLVHFWTMAVYFKLHIRVAGVFTAEAEIVGVGDKVCGSLVMDGFEDSIDFFETATEGAVLEFLVLAHFREESYKIDQYRVMLIEWFEDGLAAERRGIGSIQTDMLGEGFAPGSVWKEVILA
jgi:hypothetical protein